jgi:dTDP-4-dehydrorhamnose 3,5-epimerase
MIETDKRVKETSIPGLLILERPTFSDERGFFREVFHLDELEEASGVKFQMAQWNHSMSKPNVVRGLHGENWNKIIYPVTGEAFLAIVDIRPESQTFGKVETFNFGEQNKVALYIPIGLANSICVTGAEDVHYLYIVDKYYDGTDTRAVAWDDPDLNIVWPVEKPIISERDRHNPTLRELFPDKFK